MPNLGGPELVIILVIFILLFGARKLPELGSSVGKSIKNFKKGIDEGKDGDVPAGTTGDVPAGTTGGVGTEETAPVQRHDAP